MPAVLLVIEYDDLLGYNNRILERINILTDEPYFSNGKVYLHITAPAVRGTTPARRGILRCYKCNYTLVSATFPALPYLVPHGHPPVYGSVCDDCSFGRQDSSSEDSDEE
uniref:Silencing suppressor n=1 Tax=Cynosurus mottle virus TaxID=2931826 RepID=A0A8T9JFH3_9VIRU|nr:silencing suppressor [Cynosurus mottle virus]WMX25418.1 P1 protein [Cynosurus mottle virus]WMX25428.1 P1 protein [Cynosurus mottle virus]WMX25433.1 P1 protein [Cynosurus mottle virus]